MASDLEVRIAALRCDHLIKETPIKTTKVANTQTGIKLEYRPNEKRHNKIKYRKDIRKFSFGSELHLEKNE